MTKRLALVLATVFFVLVAVCSRVSVSAKDTWTSVRSKNFLLVGNASEKDIRQVAVRLEQFREVFSRLFPTLNVNSPVPTTVIVFKNDDSYRPFKPTEHTAGYFQSGRDVNYITLQLVKDLRTKASHRSTRISTELRLENETRCNSQLLTLISANPCSSVAQLFRRNPPRQQRAYIPRVRKN